MSKIIKKQIIPYPGTHPRRPLPMNTVRDRLATGVFATFIATIFADLGISAYGTLARTDVSAFRIEAERLITGCISPIMFVAIGYYFGRMRDSSILDKAEDKLEIPK